MGRLSKLNEEVQMHPDAALILEVIQRSRYRKVDRRKEMLDSLRAVPVFGPVLRVLYLVLESYGRALRIVVK